MRNQGSFFISCIGDVVPVPPHLPKDTQRLEYLRKKGYFGETPFSDDLVVRVMTGAYLCPCQTDLQCASAGLFAHVQCRFLRDAVRATSCGFRRRRNCQHEFR